MVPNAKSKGPLNSLLVGGLEAQPIKFGIVPPIAAFVAAGFEHSVANLYFLPYALAIKYWVGPEFWTAIGGSATDYAALNAVSATHNIVVATIGNLIGGSLLVGAVYWFVYLRRR